MFGFSIDSLTVLGMVLAVALVVDDAEFDRGGGKRDAQAGGRRAAQYEGDHGLCLLTVLLFSAIPGGFVPEEIRAIFWHWWNCPTPRGPSSVSGTSRQ